MTSARRLLIQAGAVATMGAIGLTNPKPVAAFQPGSCSHCISNYDCGGDNSSLCHGFGCADWAPVCDELFSCSGTSRLLWCSDKPQE